jgi:hypothetical protein
MNRGSKNEMGELALPRFVTFFIRRHQADYKHRSSGVFIF